MNFLSNFKIRQRILILFGAGILLLLAFGTYVLQSMNSVAEKVDLMYEHPLMVATSSIKASENMIKMHRTMKDLVLTQSDEERATELRLVEHYETEVLLNLDVVKKQILGEEGQALEAEVRESFLAWRTIRAKVVDQLAQGDMYGAAEITKAEGARYVRKLEHQFGNLKDYALNKADEFKSASDRENTSNRNVILISVFLVILGVVVIAYLVIKSLVVPILKIHDDIEKLSLGEHPKIEELQGKDELVEMNQALQRLLYTLKSSSRFATEVGEGNLDYIFSMASDTDVLGAALIEMREKLIELSEKEAERNWSTAGIARFGAFLQEHQNDMTKLGEVLVFELVKHLGANQGAIFLLHEDEEQGDSLDMLACYAWDRHKYIERSVKPGQGLIGQCYVEGAHIFMTEIPENYPLIKSGSGRSTPRSILIVPLITNNEVMGIIELASFKVMEQHEIEFVEEFGASIASTLKTSQVNSKTKALLNEAQEAYQQIAAQEEELRQNSEELAAIQEEMGRNTKAQEERILALEEELKEAKNQN